MDELVSIVLPVYNGEKYLALSIESIIKQTYQNWELLILDDCSTDLTETIAKDYVAQDNRIFISEMKKILDYHEILTEDLR